MSVEETQRISGSTDASGIKMQFLPRITPGHSSERDICYKGKVILRIRNSAKDENGKLLSVSDRTRIILGRLQRLFQHKQVDPTKIKVGMLNGMSVIYYGTTPLKENIIMTLIDDIDKKSSLDWANNLRKAINPSAQLLSPAAHFSAPANPSVPHIAGAVKTGVIQEGGKWAVTVNGRTVMRFAEQKRAVAMAQKLPTLLKGVTSFDIKTGTDGSLEIVANGKHLITLKDESLGTAVAWINNTCDAIGRKDLKLTDAKIKNLREKLVSSGDIGNAIMKAALRVKGVSYSHANNLSKPMNGLDCQGLVAYALENSGINYWRLFNNYKSVSGKQIIEALCSNYVPYGKASVQSVAHVRAMAEQQLGSGGVLVFQVEGTLNGKPAGHTGFIYRNKHGELVVYQSFNCVEETSLDTFCRIWHGASIMLGKVDENVIRSKGYAKSDFNSFIGLATRLPGKRVNLIGDFFVSSSIKNPFKALVAEFKAATGINLLGCVTSAWSGGHNTDSWHEDGHAIDVAWDGMNGKQYATLKALAAKYNLRVLYELDPPKNPNVVWTGPHFHIEPA